ncbi:MAG: DUF1549 and DUF1553 domain-containing protein [Gemmataceae bacterium]|nr:DUF1549 and DUF1553 domain-containing protein [Gemmataceae bacterium]
MAVPPRPMVASFLLLIAASFVGAQEKPLRETIDVEIRKGWDAAKLKPVSASDSVFLRRIYLDLLGAIPTYEQAKAWLADSDSQKRTKLIDRLLADPRHAAHQAQFLDLVMFGRNPPNGEATRKRDDFRQWLADRVAKNTPYDQIVREILAGEGEPGIFYAQYRGNAEETAVGVTKVFMGTQVQCARCHDHPYEPLTQVDFFGVAGFFARIVYQDGAGGPNGRKFKLGEKSTGDVLFVGSQKDAKPGQKGEPVKPKFLFGDKLAEPVLPAGFKEPDLKTVKEIPKPAFSRKEKFVEWLVKPENPFFARAAVNRLWAQYMGRGLVHPVDDLSEKNEPSHPELFTTMTKEFVARKFDVRWLIREIVNSQAYQVADEGPIADAHPSHFGRARVRPLTVEEYVAAVKTAVDYDAANPMAKGKLPGAMSEYMLRFLGEPFDGRGDFQASLSEHLYLNNSAEIAQMITPKKGTLGGLLVESKDSADAKVERLFLSVLTRLPKAEEKQRFGVFLAPVGGNVAARETASRDAIWVLINTAEFRFVR